VKRERVREDIKKEGRLTRAVQKSTQSRSGKLHRETKHRTRNQKKNPFCRTSINFGHAIQTRTRKLKGQRKKLLPLKEARPYGQGGNLGSKTLTRRGSAKANLGHAKGRSEGQVRCTGARGIGSFIRLPQVGEEDVPLSEGKVGSNQPVCKSNHEVAKRSSPT